MSMIQRQRSVAILHWSLGLVLLWESIDFAVSPNAVQHLRSMGLPEWIAPALGGIEMAAVAVFLIPRFRRIGGISLLAIFAIAATLHILHGQFEIGSLVVYSAAVLVSTSAGAPNTDEATS
ncbi:MAG TPA: DoxX family protein [Candidatus Angelobacter sp.]|nr:DoxX family protein [Candidatus Angelobacter sp.]